VADLHQHCNAHLDPRVGNDSRWRDPCRLISAAFIERVLTQEPWRSGLSFRGLRMSGALVPELLDLAAARIPAEVWLHSSRFEGEARLDRARFEGLLSLGGSTFESGINAYGVQAADGIYLRHGATIRGGPFQLSGAKVESYLDMNGSTFESGIDASGLEVSGSLFLSEGATVRGQPLYLGGAKIKGDLDMRGSTFENGLNANALQVGGRFRLDNGAVVHGQPLTLTGAKIESYLDMSGSTFESGIIAYFLQVRGSLFLREGAVVRGQTLNLAGAKIEGSLEMGGSTFESWIDANGLEVSGNLYMRDAAVKQMPAITLALIEGALDPSGAELPGLDLTGTTIGELRLGTSQLPAPRWVADASLILRGTRIKVLLDRLDASEPCPDQDAWPQKLDLQGFLYEQLGADPGSGRDMREREVCWYKRWLGRDPHFAPQPYRQLASVLRATGEPERADAVLSAARDRELTEAWTRGECSSPFKDWPWQRSDCWRAAGLSLLKALIGYGIGGGLFLVFVWVLVFTVIGVFVLRCSPAARTKGLAWMFGASLDHLLPIVSLNKEFDDFFNDPKRRRLKGWQLGYFSFHALFGFLLGSFVVAALAGLTQTS
jgi:hypothetical protein